MKKMNNEIWIVGGGLMGIEYAKVLHELNKPFKIITRGSGKATELKKLGFNCEIITGGLEKYLNDTDVIPEAAINAVGIESLTAISTLLIKAGVKKILLEKPGVAYADEIYSLNELANKNNTSILLAYNRRFYQSVIEAKKIIAEDGGVKSFNFEFTEWSHSIETLKEHKTQAELQNWFLGNSTHVIDLAFYLGGFPKEICCFVGGQNLIDWHVASSNYSGAGVSEKGALFSYHANWKAPGRFSAEILTSKHRLIFRPLEKLQIQNIGSVAINMVEGLDYSLDEKFKPGFYLQVKNFIDGNYSDLCSLNEQTQHMSLYKKMSGYK